MCITSFLYIIIIIFFLTTVSVELPDTGFSPQGTRRISSSSLLKEVVSLAASTALGGSSVSLRSGRERSKSMEKTEKKLPIINPLVRLPMWPSKRKNTLSKFKSFLLCVELFVSFKWIL